MHSERIKRGKMLRILKIKSHKIKRAILNLFLGYKSYGFEGWALNDPTRRRFRGEIHVMLQAPKITQNPTRGLSLIVRYIRYSGIIKGEMRKRPVLVFFCCSVVIFSLT